MGWENKSKKTQETQEPYQTIWDDWHLMPFSASVSEAEEI